MGVLSFVVFFAILGILVFVHELGHFLAAKSVGVAVEEFAFGFGPRLVTLFRRSGTEYTIHALPLGGFVNLVGMQPEEVHLENGLMSKPAWARAWVFIAGPLMNFLLALVVLCTMGLLTGRPTGQLSNVVLEVHKDTQAAAVGLRTGDKIVRLDDRPLKNGNELIEAIETHPGQPVTLTVERGAESLQVAARPTPELQLVPAIVVDTVKPGGPATKAGLQKGDLLVALNGEPIQQALPKLRKLLAAGDARGAGPKVEPFTLAFQRGEQTLELKAQGALNDLALHMDESPLAKSLKLTLDDRITEVDGKEVHSQEELAKVLRAKAGHPVVLSVERGTSPLTLPAQPVPVKLADADEVRTVGKMGFLPGMQFRYNTSLTESISDGLDEFRGFFVLLYRQAAEKVLFKNAGSVLTIYRATAMYSKLEAGYTISLVANLSLSLAVFNLVPIPVLDGGHLALLFVEVLRRRRLGPSVYRTATAIGFAVVVLAFMLLMYFDVMRWRSGSPLINL
jgi:membrane-associated protease RseP (regulator of RpoE activity)